MLINENTNSLTDEKRKDSENKLHRIKMMFQESSLIFVLLLLCIFLAVRSSYFLTTENLINVLRQISVVAIISVGEAFIIITAGIDLSVGSILALGGVSTALLVQGGLNSWVSLILGLAIGAFVGFINGFMVVKVGINPFITTLGMLSIARGATYLLTGGMPISFDVPASVLGSGYVGVIPVSVILMFVIILAGQLFATRTVTGRDIFAVGDNEEAARLSGIKVNNIKYFVYILSGILCALAGIITAGNLFTADTAAGSGMELDAIAAAVIGGASLSGGQGSIIGVLIGAALMGILRNGFVLLGVSAYWQVVAIGVVILLAVGLDSLSKKE